MSPEIMPLGDRALLVNFEQKIDPYIHSQVMDLLAKVEEASVDGVTFTLPAYCSVTIGFDPKKISYLDLKPTIVTLLKQPATKSTISSRSLTLPVCYEEPYALDLPEILKFSGLTPKEIIELHTGETYRVYMLGFLPGFPYLGVLPKALQFPRKRNPRLQVPERSVGIAGQQTGIYPSGSPGGWNILGNTPLPIFNSSSDSPFLLQVGDQVTFKEISSREYQKLHQQIQHQAFNWDTIYG